MKHLEKEGLCFFCNENYLQVGASPAERVTSWGYVKKNDYPYEGAVHQYLIVPHQHITNLDHLPLETLANLWLEIERLNRRLEVPGGSIFLRFGDPRYTGGTFGHLHFQFIVGGPKPDDWKPEDSIPMTLGYKVKK